MRRRIGAYLHPFDLDWLSDRGGLAALREMGVADVAFPASYHAGSWTTPVGDGGLVRTLEDGVVFFRPGPGYGEIVPVACSDMPADGPSPVERCIAEAQQAGMEAHAWTVLFHNSRLGEWYPESCVQNAMGDIYRYSLCPARPEVQEFGLRLAMDVAAHAGLTTLELEAMGFMGYKHGGHHVKRSWVLDPYLDFLLSYCFCEHCKQGLTQADVDADELHATVQGLLRRVLVDGDAMAPQKLSWQESFDRLTAGLGRKPFLGMLRHRTAVYMNFLSRLRPRLPQGVRVSVHLRMDPLFSGSQIGQPFHSVASMVDEILVTHYGERPTDMAEKWKGQNDVGRRTRVCVWPKAPEFTSDKDLVAVMNLVEERNLDGVRLYHLGLLPWKTTERALRVFAG